MMSTTFYHNNRKDPNGLSLGIRPDLANDSDLSPEVIDLDSDSDNYIFKDQLQQSQNLPSGNFNASSQFQQNYPGQAMCFAGFQAANPVNADSTAVPDLDPELVDLYGIRGCQNGSSTSSYDDAHTSWSTSISSTSPLLVDGCANKSVPTTTMRRVSDPCQIKEVPQIPYTKLNYVPVADRASVLEKVGEIRTTLIPHCPDSTNYTYRSIAKGHRKRKFSFEMPRFKRGGHNKEKNSENSSSCSGSDTSACDDADGYYIVKRGCSFANGRFRIRKLLGQGTFGKVVKAYDKKTKDVVAIKIIKAIPNYRDASKIELRIMTMLKKHDPNNLNQCMHLRECFDYRGHICIVTDVLGMSIYDFMEKNRFLPFPGSHIQGIAKQLLRSVAFLHDLNLIHTDLKPENILLKDDTFTRIPFKRPDARKSVLRKVLKDPKVYMIDFGSAIFNDEYHSPIVSTRNYRAPEIIMGTGWSFPCDIWSIACTLVEMLTGEVLFQTHHSIQHLAMIQKVLGCEIEPKMVQGCFYHFYREKGGKYANKPGREGCIADSFSKTTGKLMFPNANTPKKLVSQVEHLGRLEDVIGEAVGLQFQRYLSLEQSITKFQIPIDRRDEYTFWFYFVDLIRRMLIIDPVRRITALQAMDHEFFHCGYMDDGLVVVQEKKK